MNPLWSLLHFYQQRWYLTFFHFLVEIFFSRFFFILKVASTSFISLKPVGVLVPFPGGRLSIGVCSFHTHVILYDGMTFLSYGGGIQNTKELSSGTVKAIGCIQTHGRSLADRKWLLIVLASPQSFCSGLIRGPQKMFCSKEQSKQGSWVHRLDSKILIS